MKNTAMKTKHSLLSKISLSSGLAIAVAFAAWLPGTARAGEHDMMKMEHIMTQAQAEALKPGDCMSMTCTKCKSVMDMESRGFNASACA